MSETNNNHNESSFYLLGSLLLPRSRNIFASKLTVALTAYGTEDS